MKCQHEKTRAEATPAGPHHSKEICQICGVFLRWNKKPESIEREKREAATIKRLLKTRLTDWERNFIKSLGGKLSPRQREVLATISQKHPDSSAW